MNRRSFFAGIVALITGRKSVESTYGTDNTAAIQAGSLYFDTANNLKKWTKTDSRWVPFRNREDIDYLLTEMDRRLREARSNN